MVIGRLFCFIVVGVIGLVFGALGYQSQYQKQCKEWETKFELLEADAILESTHLKLIIPSSKLSRCFDWIDNKPCIVWISNDVKSGEVMKFYMELSPLYDFETATFKSFDGDYLFDLGEEDKFNFESKFWKLVNYKKLPSSK